MQPPSRNPYAPPIVDDVPPPPGSSEHEATRRAHLNAETNVKSLGALALIGGAVNLFGGVALVTQDPIGGVLALVIAGMAIASGIGLRRLDPRGRLLYTALAGVVILRSAWATYGPAGVVLGEGEATRVFLVPVVFLGLFLWLLWGTKGRVVFTDHYRDVVIPATPHVKYKTSKVTIFVLLLLVVVLLFTVSAAVTGC